MGIKDIFKKSENSVVDFYTPQFIHNAVKDKVLAIDNPNFKGEVKQSNIKFPAELGEEHPFDFAVTEGLYKKFGFATGVVDKFVDFIVGPGFWVDSNDERGTKIIEDFMRDVNFDTVLRGWVKEGLIKNGFMELGGKENESIKGIKVLDSKYMYVKRDKLGVVEGYNQYRGGFDKFAKDKVNPFKPYQIAHIAFNKIGDMAYGLGIIYPAVNTINNLLQNEKDLHVLMHRKANSPYHIKLGGVVGGRYMKPNPAVVEKFGKDLEWLHNKHEWVTDGLTEIKAVDFGNIGEKFNEVLKYDEEMLLYTFQVPSVLMGTANINEGIAKVQMDAFERRVKSFQAEIEKVIEGKIFRRILNANGLEGVHVEFHWGRPSNTERYERIDRIANLIKTPVLSSSLLTLLEKDLVKSLELDEEEYDRLHAEEEVRNEEERKREEERPQPIVPGQNAKPPKPVPKEEMLLNEKIEESYLNRFKTINEWLGFNYKEYKNEIIKAVRKDNFDLLLAKSKLEEDAGKFTESQIRELKKIMEDGFREEKSLKEMAALADKNVKPKDLLKMKDGKILLGAGGLALLAISKEKRSINIVRTEVTRMANIGAENHFKSKGIKKVRWVSSYGPRTCEECASLDGQVFNIGEGPRPPIHTNCRCSTIEVKG